MLRCRLGEIISGLELRVVEVLNIFVSSLSTITRDQSLFKLRLPCELFEKGVLGKTWYLPGIVLL